jgi:hypothetical protein
VDHKQLLNELQALAERLSSAAQLASANLPDDKTAPLIKDCLARIKECEDKLHDADMLADRVGELEGTQGNIKEVQKGLE